MEKQMMLPLDKSEREQQWRVWRRLPEQSRNKLVEQYARLIARAARKAAHSYEEEANHEGCEQ